MRDCRGDPARRPHVVERKEQHCRRRAPVDQWILRHNTPKIGIAMLPEQNSHEKQRQRGKHQKINGPPEQRDLYNIHQHKF